ncbi:MAG: RIO1 family regulatory kinase/ATPase [Ktedonobacteraceae bacterium]
MRYDSEFDQFDEDQEIERFRPIKMKKRRGAAGVHTPPPKESYEGHAGVQRWLKEQALDESDDKPKFNPTFLASQRDGAWILSSLEHFYEEDLITDVLHVVRSGKEASVYCCAAHPATGAAYLAAKVYRPRMFRSLKNDAIYRQSRLQHDREGRIVRNIRRFDAGNKGRALQVQSWIEYEFETQRLLHESGANVPRPVSQIGNAVLMEYIGDVDDPAPLLKEVRLTRNEARSLFDCVMRNIALFLAHGRIHGDLSEYNILYWRGAVSIIDFAQAVDPRQNQAVFPLLLRDVERVCSYFARYGVVADARELAWNMWNQQVGALF